MLGILILILVTSISIIFAYWFIVSQKTVNTPTPVEQKELNEQEKISILNDMAKKGTTTLSKEEKIDILEELKNKK